MPPALPPKPVAVEIIATRPTEADRAAIAHLSAVGRRELAPVTYIVKMRLETMPEPTGQGWALYVNDFRVPKYWETRDGIYFKMFDARFFQEHHGKHLRFSQNGIEFVDTGLTLPEPAPHDPALLLPAQENVLR
jgi:hypothetical protein